MSYALPEDTSAPTHIPGAVERVVEPAVGDVNEVVLDAFPLGQRHRVHVVRRAEFLRPRLLARVGVDSDDT